jgi:hypothetical protein
MVDFLVNVIEGGLAVITLLLLIFAFILIGMLIYTFFVEVIFAEDGDENQEDSKSLK